MISHSDPGAQDFGMLTDEQAKTIVVATLTVMGEASEAHLLRVLHYIDEALLAGGLIQNVIAGHAAIVRFAPDGAAEFTITPAGKAHVEQMLGAAALAALPKVLAVRCPHCGEAAGEPCRSVGGRPIVDPHMKRLAAMPASTAHEGTSVAIDAYARWVVESVIGRCTPELLKRAQKERAIDVAKPFWRRAFHETARLASVRPPTPTGSPDHAK